MLIVEDDAASRDLLARLLTRLGYSTRAVGTVSEANRELPRHTHLILDLLLTDGDGSMVLERARAQPRPIRIALVTGASDSSAFRRAMAFRPDAVFSKPLNVSELVHWLNQPG